MMNCPAGTYTIVALSLGETFVLPSPASEEASAGTIVGFEAGEGVTGAQLAIRISVIDKTISTAGTVLRKEFGKFLRVNMVSPLHKKTIRLI